MRTKDLKQSHIPVDFDLYLFHDTVVASVVAQHQCSIALPSSLPWAVSGEQSGVSVMDAEQSSHLMTKAAARSGSHWARYHTI